MREQWVADATEVLGAPVADAVPVPQLRSNVWQIDIAGLAVLGGLVLVHMFVVPFPHLVVILVCAVMSILSTRLRQKPRFVALTRDGRLWMLTATHWLSRPLAPIGAIDPGLVSGPVGLLRLTFIIDGARHTVLLTNKEPFQQMVETARRRAADSARS
jgi:hypothetical protein